MSAAALPVATPAEIRETMISLREDAKQRGLFYAVEAYGWSLIRANSELLAKGLPLLPKRISR